MVVWNNGQRSQNCVQEKELDVRVRVTSSLSFLLSQHITCYLLPKLDIGSHSQSYSEIKSISESRHSSDF